MPTFTLLTNLPQSKISPDSLSKASELVADLFGVKQKDVLVTVSAGVKMSWGHTPGTFALGTVQNTDPIQSEDTNNFAPAIFEFCDKQLSIPRNRMYLGFITLNPENIAFNGSIYATTEMED